MRKCDTKVLQEIMLNQFESSNWRKLFAQYSSIEQSEAWWKLYYFYMRSNAWSKNRKARIDLDSGVCAECKSTGEKKKYLEVHHLNYFRIGDENLQSDLVTLCRFCHYERHDRIDCLRKLEGPRPWDEHVRLGLYRIFENIGVADSYKASA